MFGFETQNPVVRALDWLEKWQNEKHVVRGLKSYLTEGVRSRKERHGELWGRIISGYFNEPQDVVHIHTPYASSDAIVSDDPQENWRHFFDMPASALRGHKHAAYAMLDVPEVRLDNYKGRQYVFPDSVPPEERQIKALFVRTDALSAETLREIVETCRGHGLPLFDIETFKKI